MLMTAMAEQAFVGGKIRFPTVARTVGFGLERPKILYLSMKIH